VHWSKRQVMMKLTQLKKVLRLQKRKLQLNKYEVPYCWVG
jgi:hypothetical protein